MDNHRYLKPAAAAEKLGVSIGTLANWRWKGIGPDYYRVGSLIRYDGNDLDEWLRVGWQPGGYDRSPSAVARP